MPDKHKDAQFNATASRSGTAPEPSMPSPVEEDATAQDKRSALDNGLEPEGSGAQDVAVATSSVRLEAEEMGRGTDGGDVERKHAPNDESVPSLETANSSESSACGIDSSSIVGVIADDGEEKRQRECLQIEEAGDPAMSGNADEESVLFVSETLAAGNEPIGEADNGSVILVVDAEPDAYSSSSCELVVLMPHSSDEEA